VIILLTINYYTQSNIS